MSMSSYVLLHGQMYPIFFLPLILHDFLHVPYLMKSSFNAHGLAVCQGHPQGPTDATARAQHSSTRIRCSLKETATAGVAEGVAWKDAETQLE